MSQPRQPWSMKWVALAIVVFIALYTWLTLAFRKPGPAYRPYEDIGKRANVAHLLAAGYQRIALAAERPTDVGRLPSQNLAPVTVAPAGLPSDLRATFLDQPRLPDDILQVWATADAAAGKFYVFECACAVASDKEQLAGAELYVHGDQLVITPTFERVSGGLLTRYRQTAVLVTVPPNALKPGRYDVTLVGERSSRRWSLQVH